jgi:hypothetical protein
VLEVVVELPPVRVALLPLTAVVTAVLGGPVVIIPVQPVHPVIRGQHLLLSVLPLTAVLVVTAVLRVTTGITATPAVPLVIIRLGVTKEPGVMVIILVVKVQTVMELISATVILLALSKSH